MHAKISEMNKYKTMIKILNKNIVQARIAEMDRDGITVQALSTVPVMFSYWVRTEEKYFQLILKDLTDI